jgi:hypothetical protein
MNDPNVGNRPSISVGLSAHGIATERAATDEAVTARASQRVSGAPPTSRRPSIREWSELAPETQSALRDGVEQLARGELADLSPEESRHYVETGELPERVELWLEDFERRSAI